jgi:hypothetical protein
MALDGTRGGESVWVPVLELELGVPNDQASMSSRMSATSKGSDVRGRARGTTIESGLRPEFGDEVDARGVAAAGAGGERRKGCVAEVGEGGRGMGGGGRGLDLGKVGSICELGPGTRGRSWRGLLILLRPGRRFERRRELRGSERRDSGRAGQFEGTSGKESAITSPNSREYHNTSSSSSSSSSSDSSSSGPSGKKDSRVNSIESSVLAWGISVDLEIAYG